MTGPAVLLYVQSLLGIGHLRRAGVIAAAMAAAGLDVTMVSGSPPVPGIGAGAARLAQLPPVRAADDSFKLLLDEHDRPIDDAWKGQRRDRLLAILDEVRPTVLITELFPFGRRQMRFELLPLLDRAHARAPRPRIACSVRDILVSRPDAARNQEVVQTLQTYYDRILVHGDERVIALDETFPMLGPVAGMLSYTAYAVTADAVGADAAQAGASSEDGAGEVVVSAGGGAAAAGYMQAVLRLRPTLPLAGHRWRFVTGQHMPEPVFAAMRQAAGGDTIVERSRPDLPAVLGRAALAIAQAGYNTVAELLAAGTPAVVVPFEGGAETEQRIRAERLAARGLLQMVPERDLTADRLGAAMRAAVAGGRRSNPGIRLDGAARTAALVGELAGAA